MSEVAIQTDVLKPRRQANATGRSAFRVESYGLTDRGRVRRSNEDQILIAELTKRMRICQSSLSQPQHLCGNEAGHLFVVADGMGGRQGGEEASALAVRAVEDFMLNVLQWFLHLRGPEGEHLLEQFQSALREADTAVYEQARNHPELWGMGTTLTLAFALNRDLFIAHAGDSRAYLLRQRVLYQLTHDHTLVGEMVRQGMLKKEEAAHHRLRHVITNVVGGTEAGIQVDVHRVELQAGDTLLLCSDGVTEMLSNDQIVAVLASRPSARCACEQLVSAANDAGGTDNLSVIVTHFHDANAAE